MRRPLLRLVHTTTFRLALLYMAVFGTSVLVLLGFIYVSTVGVIEQQVSATIEAEIRGLEEQYRQRGLPGLQRIVAQRSVPDPASEERSPGGLYLLLGPAGEQLAGNISRWPEEGLPEVRRDDAYLIFPIRLAPNQERRAGATRTHQARALTFVLPGGYRLLVGRDMRERLQFQDLIEDALAWSLAITLLLGMLGGIAMSRNMLRRLDDVNRTSRRIMEGELSHRIPVTEARDEFDRLAMNLNGMLDRIERLMAGMREVTDNVAHDLRSPLTRLKSRLEVTLLSERDPARLRAVLEDTVAETDRMLATFNALLSIARLESGAQEILRHPVDLAALVADAADLYGPVLEEAGLSLALDCPASLPMLGDEHLLTQSIVNLLDNVCKYGQPAAGSGEHAVTLRLAPAPNGDVLLSVADHGPGIPVADRDRVLQRYVRLERSRTAPGNGLGLALVAAVARLHGGSVTLTATLPEPPPDGRGLTVTLRLPAGSVPTATAADEGLRRAVASRVRRLGRGLVRS